MSDETEGQDEGNAVDLESQEVKDAIAAAVKEAKAGLDKKNKELLGKLKAASEKAKEWEGLDPEEVHKTMELFQSSEEAQLLKDGKFEDVIAKRTEKMAKAHEKAIQALQDQVEGERAVSARALERLGKLEIDGKLTEALLGAGVNKEALLDGLARGRGVFRFDDEHNVRPLDGDGDPVFGADGKSDLTMAEWASGLKDTAPHFFVSLANRGGGAGGSKGVSGDGKQIKRSDFDSMAHHKQKEFISSGGKVVD